MEKYLSVIIPTYNEKDNVSRLLAKLHETLSSYRYEVLLMDDNSRDGTIALAQSLAAVYPVSIIVRQGPKGLAAAVADGFNAARGQVFVVMDADLQHPPELIPALLKNIEDGADVAISSRYIPGGGTRNWSLTRRIISRGAIFITHLFLPSTRSIKDVTTGFFAVKRQVVEGAQFRPIGWKILLEVLYEGKYSRVIEVPFVFVGRTQGRSKLRVKPEIDYLKHIWSLMRRKGELSRFIKFCLVGGSGVLVNLGVYWLLTRLAALLIYYASSISFEVSVISNFALNEFFTFQDRRGGSTSRTIMRLLKFNGISLVGLGLQQGALWLFNSVIGVSDIAALVFGIIIATLWNYFLNSWWTWK